MDVSMNRRIEETIVDETGIYTCQRELVHQMSNHLDELEQKIDNIFSQTQTNDQKKSEYKVAFTVLGFLIIVFVLVALRSYDDYLYM